MKKLIVFVLIFALPVIAQQSQQAITPTSDIKTLPYDMRTFARSAGNVGGWWGSMSENEKSAFLDGYKSAMIRANQLETNVCTVLRQDIEKDHEMPIKAMIEVANVCIASGDTAGYEKVTIKDLDNFYSDPINQPMLLEWTMPYLRDKTTGKKTEGQLLDELKAEQKDIHNCMKYPYLCNLGTSK